MNKVFDSLFLLIFVTLLLVYNATCAQNILRTDLPTYRQLPVSNLHHIVQDGEGYMWYATDAGLCRDNGYQVDVFRNDVAHPDFWKSNHIFDIAVGTDDKIWVVNEAGLYYLDKTSYTVTEVKERSVSNTNIRSVSVMSDGSVWAVGGKEIVRLSASGVVEKVYKATNAGDGHKFVNRVYEDSHHNIWLYECRGKLKKLNVGKDKFEDCTWVNNCEPYGGFVEDKHHGCLWISTWGRGIVKYIPYGNSTNGKLEFQPCTYEGNTLKSNKGKIVSMNVSSDGKTLWCTAMDGFYAYKVCDNGALESIDISDLLPPGKKVLATVNADRYGNMWVASYSPRTFILSPHMKGVKRYDVPSVLKETGIATIAENVVFDDDYVWIWHLRLNMMLYDQRNDKNHMFILEQKDGVGSRVMCECRSGGVWTTTGNHVWLLQHQGDKVISSDVTEVDTRIIQLYDDGKGRVWIGTLNDVWVYDVAKQSLKCKFKNVGYVRGMLISPSGDDLYFLADMVGFGVGRIANGYVRSLKSSIPERFEAFDVSDAGRVSLSTDLGSIYSYDVEHHRLIRDNDASLPNSDNVIDIAYDGNGHLWILTSQFVREYNAENRSSRYIYASDANVDFDYFLFLKRHGKEMCVGGAGGYCLIKSIPILEQNRKPKITSIVVDGKKYFVSDSTECFTMHHGDMNLSINFSVLDHLHSRNISYAYCLHPRETVADKWVYLPVGHNTAYFAEVKRGDYVLDVKATDVYGNWGKEVRCLNIEKLPAWWETWWMILLYFMAVVTLVALIAHVYYQNQMKNMEIQKLVNLAKELRESQTMRAEQVDGDDESVESEDVAAGNATKDGEKTTSIQLTKAEQEFVANAKMIVERNIDNSGYTTEQFASDMCMSRMNLYRKLQKITGQKPSEFIRMIRLQMAAKLLKSDDLAISEIAERVGFSSPSYFTKCFKEAFGVQPGQYR